MAAGDPALSLMKSSRFMGSVCSGPSSEVLRNCAIPLGAVCDALGRRWLLTAAESALSSPQRACGQSQAYIYVVTLQRWRLVPLVAIWGTSSARSGSPCAPGRAGPAWSLRRTSRSGWPVDPASASRPGSGQSLPRCCAGRAGRRQRAASHGGRRRRESGARAHRDGDRAARHAIPCVPSSRLPWASLSSLAVLLMSRSGGSRWRARGCGCVRHRG